MSGWWLKLATASLLLLLGSPAVAEAAGSVVSTVQKPDGSYAYVVNGREQTFIGMGYDPIYRYLPDAQRKANYERDFTILQQAGVNTITGWDADKGYEQDKFDELTLDTAQEHGLGVIMPLNLPPEGDYTDPDFVASLLEQGRQKLLRFRDHPALRMWGVGNEAFWGMDPGMYAAFEQAYVRIADRFHQLDPNHPVIYRDLSPAVRAAAYRRDFQILHQAGVNTITGWDADKGYEQDKFDELTLNMANQYGIGVVMPIYMPADVNYTDPDLIGSLLKTTVAKVQRYRINPALRMWGVGNEVLVKMPPEMDAAFLQVYLNVIDLVHQMDPYHPVIYREAEDEFVPMLAQLLRDSGDRRPWLLYGMNVYDKDPEPLLRRWPSYGLDRPLFVSEFGSQGAGLGGRPAGYASMWRSIRGHPDYVLGGAPYAWSVDGPEPTDKLWGLTNSLGLPVDGTLAALQQLWLQEPRANHGTCLP